MLDWDKYISVADRFQHKAIPQDRQDLKHSIILKLTQVANNNGHKPFTEATMCRIASFVVSDYWRTQYKFTNGLDCGACGKAQRAKCRKEELYSECPKAVKLEYLSKPILDSEEHITELGELIADDNAVDVAARLDARLTLQSYPHRFIKIAYKKYAGYPLTAEERIYLYRQRHKALKSSQKRLVLV